MSFGKRLSINDFPLDKGAGNGAVPVLNYVGIMV